MTERTSENAFNKGLSAVGRRDYLEALAYFEASMQLGKVSGTPPPMKYLSYYGLCLAMTSQRINEARRICEQAIEVEFYNPDLYLNLGRVYLKEGERGQAFGAFVRGLQLNPRHAALVRELRRLGIRRRPVLGFLRRNNPLNRMLGLLRASARQQAQAH
jgi:tetratricopeptide (TPR) repeat protein